MAAVLCVYIVSRSALVTSAPPAPPEKASQITVSTAQPSQL
jgi:hypothetical protein